MEISELDRKLRKLSKSEKELKRLSKCKENEIFDDSLEEYFSNQIRQGDWTINFDKLIDKGEDISIHKHDRFIKFNKHKHDYLEMMFVYSGSIIQTIEGRIFEIKKGEIILLDMNVEHSIEEAGKDDIAVDILIKKEFFDLIFMKEIGNNDLIANFIIKALYEKDKFKQYLYFKTSENRKVWKFMMGILMEYYENKNGREIAIRSYMVLLFNELLRDYNKYLPDKLIYKIDSNIASEIMEYIKNNFRNINLRILAKHFNYSIDYTGKLIKKATGKNLTELIKEMKIDYAKNLLRYSDIPISSIILETGYCNLTYFYKEFKKSTGSTPDEYRKIKLEAVK